MKRSSSVLKPLQRWNSTNMLPHPSPSPLWRKCFRDSAYFFNCHRPQARCYSSQSYSGTVTHNYLVPGADEGDPLESLCLYWTILSQWTDTSACQCYHRESTDRAWTQQKGLVGDLCQLGDMSHLEILMKCISSGEDSASLRVSIQSLARSVPLATWSWEKSRTAPSNNMVCSSTYFFCPMYLDNYNKLQHHLFLSEDTQSDRPEVKSPVHLVSFVVILIIDGILQLGKNSLYSPSS